MRSFDMYGVPISFNLNGDEKFKTFIGGGISFILAFTIILYSLSQFYTMVNKTNNTVSTSIIYRDLQQNVEDINVGELGFTFGIIGILPNGTSDRLFDKTYFSTNLKIVKTSTVNGASITTNETIALEKCGYKYHDNVTGVDSDKISLNNYY